MSQTSSGPVILVEGLARSFGDVLAAVFGLAIWCIAAFTAFTGLAIGEESVQAFGLIWIFPLIFVSSAFVRIGSMPGWLQAFANNPAGHLRDQDDARAGAGRPANGGPVEEPAGEPAEQAWEDDVDQRSD